MAVFNAAKREIDLKIVYYGPAMCGKTTNVQCIHKMLAPQQRGDLMSLATKDDRTLFFDFLPIELGDVRGFKTRFHIYTVPGQVYYGLTRRAVLTGADGVVFVADSQTNKLQDNLESLKDLADNLKFYKKDITSFPFVLQYNKRDLPHVASVDELNAMLNSYNVPAYESSALTGMGVVETLTGICKMVLKQMDSGTAKKKTVQPSATIPPGTKDAAAATRPSVAPSITEADDAGLKILAEAPTVPAFAKKTEPVQQDQSPLAAAPAPEQKPALRLTPIEPPPVTFDDAGPSASASFEKSDVPRFDSIPVPTPPAFDAPSADISSDDGLSFDDEETLVLDEAGVPEQELSFEDEETLVLDEAGVQEPELSFEDEETLVLDEAGVQEPELSFDDEETLVLEEAGVQETELSFDDEDILSPDEAAVQGTELSFDDDSAVLAIEEPALDIEAPELSFDEKYAGLAVEPVPGASPLHANLSAFTIEEPSLEFEKSPAAEAFAPPPVQTPKGEGFSIVSCGQPRKISDTSISLPMTIRLNKNDAECPITITISLDDMQVK